MELMKFSKCGSACRNAGAFYVILSMADNFLIRKKLSWLFCATCLLGMLACSKSEMHECAVDVIHFNADLGFKGFTSDELDTVVIAQYKANGKFDSLIKQDTLYPYFFVYQDMLIIHDTALHFQGIGPGVDYEINIPATNNRFLITKIAGPAFYHHVYLTESACPRSTTEIAGGPDSAVINGIGVGPLDIGGLDGGALVLHR